jgi:hypothetical protein
VHGKPNIEEYDEAFHRLSLIESAQSWWWGDLANAREGDYPEDPESNFKYGSLKEIAERYGKDYHSLGVCQHVASRYQVLSRLKTLGFKHHLIAAPLDNRLEWLKGVYTCQHVKIISHLISTKEKGRAKARIGSRSMGCACSQRCWFKLLV